MELDKETTYTYNFLLDRLENGWSSNNFEEFLKTMPREMLEHVLLSFILLPAVDRVAGAEEMALKWGMSIAEVKRECQGPSSITSNRGAKKVSSVWVLDKYQQNPLDIRANILNRETEITCKIQKAKELFISQHSTSKKGVRFNSQTNEIVFGRGKNAERYRFAIEMPHNGDCYVGKIFDYSGLNQPSQELIWRKEIDGEWIMVLKSLN